MTRDRGISRRRLLAGIGGAGTLTAAGASDPGVRRVAGSFMEDLACSAGYSPERYEEVSDFEPNSVYRVADPVDLDRPEDYDDGFADFLAETRKVADAEDEVLIARRRRLDPGLPHEYRTYRFDGDAYEEVAGGISDDYVTAFFPEAEEHIVRTPCIDRTGPFENGDLPA